MKILSLILVSAFSLPTLAQDAISCTDWEPVPGIECVFAGDDATPWRRICHDETQICKHRQFNLCLKEKLCWTGNPNKLETPCSDWVKNQGVRCFNRSNGKWEQAWKRACTVGNIEETLCSDDL